MNKEESRKEWLKHRDRWLHGDLSEYGAGDIGDLSVHDKIWQEGEDAFNATLSVDENNPYGNNKGYLSELRSPWYFAFREAKRVYFENKYKIPELQAAIRRLVIDHGLEIKYDDEYNTPYGETPEGYGIALGAEP